MNLVELYNEILGRQNNGTLPHEQRLLNCLPTKLLAAVTKLEIEYAVKDSMISQLRS